ncbi:MAG: putative membrane protein [Planctomycetota bacterium]|jgi:uncharacterized membrane protein
MRTFDTIDWADLFSRFHPVLLHLPIGLFITLAWLHFWGLFKSGEQRRPTAIIWLLVISTPVAAASGWLLHESASYPDPVDWHEWCGIALAFDALFIGVAHWRSSKFYAPLLWFGFVLLFPTAHFGGTLTHGEGFLLAPLMKEEVKPSESRITESSTGTLPPIGEEIASAVTAVTAVESPAHSVNFEDVQPIFEDLCVRCHGERKQRGGLALHTLAALEAGGDSGRVLVGGPQADANLLMQRLLLPIDHEDHMPPAKKSQPDAAELQLIEEWILTIPSRIAGDESAAVSPQLDPQPEAEPSSKTKSPQTTVAIVALRERLAHVQLIAAVSSDLWIDFVSVVLEPGELQSLLEPLENQIVELSLAGKTINQDDIAYLAQMPRLVDLDLRRMDVEPLNIEGLATAPVLHELNLAGTPLQAGSLDVLARVSTLDHVYLWGTGQDDSIEALRASRPDLEVIVDPLVAVDALEVEAEVVFEHPHQHSAIMHPEWVRPQPSAEPVFVGSGANRYRWDSRWLKLADGRDWLGSTHGCIVVDKQGRVYLSAETGPAVLVFSAEGVLENSFGEEWEGGLHGISVVTEASGDEGAEREVLYLAHTGRQEVIKTTLEGEVLARFGAPPESTGLYMNPDHYRPTSVAVAEDGTVFIADGYGLSWVHRFSADGVYLDSFGGRGEAIENLSTPHGLWWDTLTSPSTLLVSDRENHRLARFSHGGEFIEATDPESGLLRRPCHVQFLGELGIVSDLAGRATLLNGKLELIAQLGDNPDPAQRAQYGITPDLWREGVFLAPHCARFTLKGDIIVMDWNVAGRVTLLIHDPEE